MLLFFSCHLLCDLGSHPTKATENGGAAEGGARGPGHSVLTADAMTGFYVRREVAVCQVTEILKLIVTAKK